MNLDLIGQLVKILRDAPELGAIEVRRGLFGLWASVRVSKAGHGIGNAAGPVVVTSAAPAAAVTAAAPATSGGAAAAHAAPSGPALLEIKSPMVGTFYKSPEPGAEPYVKNGTRVAPG